MAGTQRVPHLRLRSKTRRQQGPQRRSTEAAAKGQSAQWQQQQQQQQHAPASSAGQTPPESAQPTGGKANTAEQTSTSEQQHAVRANGVLKGASHCGTAPDLSDARHGVQPAACPLLEAPACATGRPSAAGSACCHSEPHLGIEHLAPHRPAEHVFERVPVQVDRPQALHRGRHGCLQRAAEADEHELHERWRRARAAEHSRQRRRHTQRCRGATAHRDK